jgi:fructose-bisphosphate aldolase class II
LNYIAIYWLYNKLFVSFLIILDYNIHVKRNIYLRFFSKYIQKINILLWRFIMLVSTKEMLTKAKEGKYAVGQFNINNLEWTKAVLLTAQENNSPVILGVSEGAGKYMGGYHAIVGMVNGLMEDLKITVPVALHLDHGSYEGAFKVIEAGFSSVMFDGSHYAIDENIEKTKEVIKAAYAKGLSVEAEVGSIGGEEDGVIGAGEVADPAECKRIADLGVTMLAAGIGNIHGVYPANWAGLNFDVLAQIEKTVGSMPLVLHGGTGIPADMIKEAISLGVAKINVNTECQLVFAAATRKYIEEGKDKAAKGFDPRKLLAPGFEAIKDIVKEKMVLFGSVNRA